MRTYKSAHMQAYVYYIYPSPVIVLASPCLQHFQLLPTLPRLFSVMVWMYLDAPTWQCKTALLVTFSVSMCGRSARTAVLCDGRDALGVCQLAI